MKKAHQGCATQIVQAPRPYSISKQTEVHTRTDGRSLAILRLLFLSDARPRNKDESLGFFGSFSETATSLWDPETRAGLALTPPRFAASIACLSKACLGIRQKLLHNSRACVVLGPLGQSLQNIAKQLKADAVHPGSCGRAARFNPI